MICPRSHREPQSEFQLQAIPVAVEACALVHDTIRGPLCQVMPRQAGLTSRWLYFSVPALCSSLGSLQAQGRTGRLLARFWLGFCCTSALCWTGLLLLCPKPCPLPAITWGGQGSCFGTAGPSPCESKNSQVMVGLLSHLASPGWAQQLTCHGPQNSCSLPA